MSNQPPFPLDPCRACHRGVAPRLTVATAATSLSAVSAPAFALVDGSPAASTTLSRVDGGAIATGQTITFTLTAPGGSTTALSGTTDGNGLAAVTFTPTVKGAHTVAATFTADCCLTGASAVPASVAVYQRTALSLPSVSGAVGSPITIRATLTTVPGGLSVAGQAVDLSFSGAGVVPAAQTGIVTDSNGVASIRKLQGI